MGGNTLSNENKKFIIVENHLAGDHRLFYFSTYYGQPCPFSRVLLQHLEEKKKYMLGSEVCPESESVSYTPMSVKYRDYLTQRLHENSRESLSLFYNV